MSIKDHAPDPSTLSRFRKELTQKAKGRMLKKINRQPPTHKLMIRTRQVKGDASLTERPFSPKGTRIDELVEDSMEEDQKDDQKEKE